MGRKGRSADEGKSGNRAEREWYDDEARLQSGDEVDAIEDRHDSRFEAKWMSRVSSRREVKKHARREQLDGEPQATSERYKEFRTIAAVEQFEHTLSSLYLEILKPSQPDDGVIDCVQFLSARLFEHLKRSPDAIHALSPRQFEELVAEILASFGWRVELTRASKDGGYDIFGVHRDASGLESAWLVECKKYRPDRPIGVELVRSFWAVKSNLAVPNGLIATTSRFTKGAEQFKTSRWDLSFRDLDAVLAWVNEYRPNADGSLYLRDQQLVVGERKP